MRAGSNPGPTAIDQRELRDVLGHYPTGVVVVTGILPDGNLSGMVVGTFSSVSLDPPLVSFMPTAGSITYAALREASVFTINVLAHDQRDVCRVLSSRDPRKFDKVSWRLSPYGTPQLDGAVAHIHARPSREIEAGDHLIVLCEVLDVDVARPVTPLLFFQGGYGGFSASGLAAHVDSSLISAARFAEVARPQLDRLAQRFGISTAAIVQVNDHEQTIGATAYGGSVSADERLGARLPLIPPLGEVTVAWSPEHAQRWLDRIPESEEALLARYRARLAAVREHGYGLTRIRPESRSDYDGFDRAINEYSRGQLTPARDRAVRSAIAAGAAYFDSFVLGDEPALDIAFLVVPVFDPAADSPANSGLVIRLGNLPRGVPGETVLSWVTAAKEAAAEVTAALAGPARREYEHYVAAGLRDQP